MDYFGLDRTNEILHSIIHTMLTGFLQLIISLPWSICRQFWLEERHGFNKMGPCLFVTDLLKQVSRVERCLCMLPLPRLWRGLPEQQGCLTFKVC